MTLNSVTLTELPPPSSSLLSLHPFPHIPLHAWKLATVSGLEIIVTNLGLITQSIQFPDAWGTKQELALGFKTLDEYLTDGSYQGRVVVPYANRISGAQVVIDKVPFPLFANNGPNNLHSGINPNDMQTIQGANRVWKYEDISIRSNSVSLYFSLPFASMEGGFPGEITYIAEVSLTSDNVFSIQLSARNYSNQTAISSPTFHGYFNLNGQHSDKDIKNHLLQTNAGQYIVTDGNNIPIPGLAAITSVEGTPFDFRQMRSVYDEKFASLWDVANSGVGYDHCLVNPDGDFAATLISPHTGIGMEVTSNQRGGQLYTGFYLDGTPFGRYGGMCIEPGKGIDAVNHEFVRNVVGSPFVLPRAESKFMMSMRFFRNDRGC